MLLEWMTKMMFLSLLFYLAVWDWKKQIIPNKVILPAIGMAFLIRFFHSDLTLFESILGFLFAGGTFFAGAWMGKIGGGDVKLMAFVGFVLGFWNILYVLMILSIFLLVTWAIKGNQAVPFAPYVFVAVVLFYLKGGINL